MKNQIGNRGNNESTRSSWKYETSRLLKKNMTLAVADQCDLFLRRFHEPRLQFRKCFVLCYCLLYPSVHFPIGLSHRDKKLPGPHTSVKPGKPKKFGTVLFEDCLRLLGGLDHILRFVAFEACKLYNSRDLIPPMRSRQRRSTAMSPVKARSIAFCVRAVA
jgi:hypothetical protein